MRLLPIVLVGAVACTTAEDPCTKKSAIDECWTSYLQTPPQGAVELGEQLSARADKIAANLSKTLAVTGDFDVSISGGGNYDAYYMGVAMVFAKVKALRQHRYTGASAGGMMPWEINLKGMQTTLETHLAYGFLTALYPLHFVSGLDAATQDHHWRLMAAWQTAKYSAELSSLDNKVYLALSCLDPLPKLVIVSNYTAKDDQATKAFMATGTLYESYNGMACSDGGAESGKDMTPLFQDNVRPQVIVNIMQTGYPSEMVGKIVTQQWANLTRMGMDEAAEFLETGKVARNAKAITFCPLGSKVNKNVCEKQNQTVLV